jgi:hypothetical protein
VRTMTATRRTLQEPTHRERAMRSLPSSECTDDETADY